MSEKKNDSIEIVTANAEEDKAKKKKNFIKNVLYLVFIILITGLVVYFSCKDNFEQIKALFSGMNLKYFFILLGMVLLNFCINSLIIWVFVKLYQNGYHYTSALANNAVGVFYSGISPGGSGGQFVQIYTFSKQGVPFAHSASILIMQYIVYDACLVTQAIICFLTHFKDFMSVQTIDLAINGVNIPIPFLIFIVIGFVANALMVLVLFMAGYSKKLHKFVCGPCINLLAKLHLLKNPEETRLKVKTSVENFRMEFRRLQSNISFAIVTVVLTFVGLFVVESIPFFCGLALNAYQGLDSFADYFDKIFTSIAYTNMHQLVCGLIPLPGSSGVSEFVFIKCFEGYFNAPGFDNEGGINAVMLLWRFSTFIIPFFVCGLVSALYKPKQGSIKEQFETFDNTNYITVSMDTYNAAQEKFDKEHNMNTSKITSLNIYQTLEEESDEDKKEN